MKITFFFPIPPSICDKTKVFDEIKMKVSVPHKLGGKQNLRETCTLGFIVFSLTHLLINECLITR
jgi:hypothetical protein